MASSGETQVALDDFKIESLRLPTEAYLFGEKALHRSPSLVRITHLPSAITVECKEHISAHRNRDSALAMLKQKLAGI